MQDYTKQVLTEQLDSLSKVLAIEEDNFKRLEDRLAESKERKENILKQIAEIEKDLIN